MGKWKSVRKFLGNLCCILGPTNDLSEKEQREPTGATPVNNLAVKNMCRICLDENCAVFKASSNIRHDSVASPSSLSLSTPEPSTSKLTAAVTAETADKADGDKEPCANPAVTRHESHSRASHCSKLDPFHYDTSAGVDGYSKNTGISTGSTGTISDDGHCSEVSVEGPPATGELLCAYSSNKISSSFKSSAPVEDRGSSLHIEGVADNVALQKMEDELDGIDDVLNGDIAVAHQVIPAVTTTDNNESESHSAPTEACGTTFNRLKRFAALGNPLLHFLDDYRLSSVNWDSYTLTGTVDSHPRLVAIVQQERHVQTHGDYSLGLPTSTLPAIAETHDSDDTDYEEVL